MRILMVLALILPACGPSHSDQQVTCNTADSLQMESDGWQPLPEMERVRISQLAGEGHAEIQYVPGTLVCRIWDGDKMTVTDNAGLYYWRAL